MKAVTACQGGVRVGGWGGGPHLDDKDNKDEAQPTLNMIYGAIIVLF